MSSDVPIKDFHHIAWDLTLTIYAHHTSLKWPTVV